MHMMAIFLTTKIKGDHDLCYDLTLLLDISNNPTDKTGSSQQNAAQAMLSLAILFKIITIGGGGHD